MVNITDPKKDPKQLDYFIFGSRVDYESQTANRKQFYGKMMEEGCLEIEGDEVILKTFEVAEVPKEWRARLLY